MKKNLSWKVLIPIAVGCYVVNYIDGGILGSAFALVGAITGLMGIIDLCRALFKKKA